MKLTKEQWNEVIEDFKNGLSLKELSEKYNCSTQTISKNLRNLGIKNSKQLKWVDDTYFDFIDTEEKAYLLGFLIADGCIRKEKFSVSEIEDAIQSSSDKGSQGLITVLADLFINDKITLEQAQAQIEEKNYGMLDKIIMQRKGSN